MYMYMDSSELEEAIEKQQKQSEQMRQEYHSKDLYIQVIVVL